MWGDLLSLEDYKLAPHIKVTWFIEPSDFIV